MTSQHRTHLIITSYAIKAPPLDFNPDISLSARRISNPPGQLRQNFDGRCEGLRKYLRQDSEFGAFLHEAQSQIFDAERGQHDNGAVDGAEEGAKEIKDKAEANELNVAVSCVRGRHRSVAFAEELAAMQNWPAHYVIEVKHRDVESPHKWQDTHRKNLEREKKGEKFDLFGDMRKDEESSIVSESESGSDANGEDGVGEVDDKGRRRLREIKMKGLDRADSKGGIRGDRVPEGPTRLEVMTM